MKYDHTMQLTSITQNQDEMNCRESNFRLHTTRNDIVTPCSRTSIGTADLLRRPVEDNTAQRTNIVRCAESNF